MEWLAGPEEGGLSQDRVLSKLYRQKLCGTSVPGGSVKLAGGSWGR